MIELGLQRISKLLQGVKLPWRAIHVAGTNGKGSVCAYASAMLHSQGVPCGRFTSPHLIDRWDCITINEKTVDESMFREVESQVTRKNETNQIQASEFEVLTATAFEIFSRERVEVGVVEVGMGGALDATNVLENPFCTVITKIGYDHEKYLGNSLEQITSHKAGIMKQGVSCVIDRTNDKVVLEFLENHAKKVQAPYSFTAIENWELEFEPPLDGPSFDSALHQVILSTEGWRKFLERHQQMNLSLALVAVQSTLKQLHKPTIPNDILLQAGAADLIWSGRQQYLSIEFLTGRKGNILLDGAHNPDSYEALSTHVEKNLRPKSNTKPVTWVLASTEGKSDLLLTLFVKPGDNVVTVEFGPVDGMPWVKPRPAKDMVDNLPVYVGQHSSKSNDVKAALQWATDVSKGQPLVVTGSLYLVSDVLRLLRDEERTKKSGRRTL